MVRFARRSKSCRTTSATWRDGRTRAQRGYSSWKRSLRWTINLLTLFTHIWQQQGTPRVLFIQIPNHNSDLMRFILQVKKAAFEQERIDWESANNVTIEDLKRMSLESIDGKKKSKVNEANADIKVIQFCNSCFRVRWAESASGWVPQNKWLREQWIIWCERCYMEKAGSWYLGVVRAYFEGSFQLTSEKVFWHEAASRVIVGSEVTHNVAMLTI